ncbi:MAG: hypothetical protein JST92_05285 [Deltaproteobacteria bacterium]|nr:hypothetical protein [Deltaproteobacteria bacterium]
MNSRALTGFIASAVITAAIVYSCSSGPEQAPEGTPLTHQRAGLACTSDSQCGDDRCDTTKFPGGACVGTCDSSGACPQYADAGAGQVCLGAATTGGCLRGCETDGGCVRTGWICQASPNGNVCLPDCRQAPALCDTADGGVVCNTTSGLCQAPLPPDAGAYGFCGVTSSCMNGGECLAINGQGADGGICTFPCNVADGGGCISPGSCVVTETALDGGAEGRCAVTCDAGAECNPGLTCVGVPAGSLADGGAATIGLCAP